jgi:glutaredoxin 3
VIALRMAKVEIYTTGFCAACFAAKALLESKGIAFEEVDVSDNPSLRAEMARRAGGDRTVPQVFADGRHVGDYDAVNSLLASGTFDDFLKD